MIQYNRSYKYDITLPSYLRIIRIQNYISEQKILMVVWARKFLERKKLSMIQSKRKRAKEIRTMQCSLRKIGILQIPLIHCHIVQDPVNNLSPYHKPVSRTKHCYKSERIFFSRSQFFSNIKLVNLSMEMEYEHNIYSTRNSSLHALINKKPQKSMYNNVKSWGQRRINSQYSPEVLHEHDIAEQIL